MTETEIEMMKAENVGLKNRLTEAKRQMATAVLDREAFVVSLFNEHGAHVGAAIFDEVDWGDYSFTQADNTLIAALAVGQSVVTSTGWTAERIQ